ncbi:GNAT family N-acetyltransferase [Campylobacter lari]|nr:GNAT family N-acetyltransferase [Campylobacter lari]
MDHFKIYQASINDLEDVLILASLLFNKPIVKLKHEFENILKDQKYAVFLLKTQQLCIGLAYVSIRYDYVEGSSSTPVGYLEGIYIRENFRKKYYAKKLLTYCE